MVVIRWGGTIFTRSDLNLGAARADTVVPIDEGLFLGSISDGYRTLDDYLNHSCDPNIWMADARALKTRRPIAAGEELVADYAFFFEDEDYVMPGRCNCGAACCRHMITGRDWRLSELHRSYGDHFSPFINQRIANMPNP
jgi:hypothetical protein